MSFSKPYAAHTAASCLSLPRFGGGAPGSDDELNAAYFKYSWVNIRGSLMKPLEDLAGFACLCSDAIMKKALRL